MRSGGDEGRGETSEGSEEDTNALCHHLASGVPNEYSRQQPPECSHGPVRKRSKRLPPRRESEET
jgi:hypothetical protein